MGGVALLDAAHQAFNLGDGRIHVLSVARNAAGVATVSIDGRQVISIRDSSIQGDFDGLMIVNQGGDYTIRSIAVYGAN